MHTLLSLRLKKHAFKTATLYLHVYTCNGNNDCVDWYCWLQWQITLVVTSNDHLPTISCQLLCNLIFAKKIPPFYHLHRLGCKKTTPFSILAGGALKKIPFSVKHGSADLEKIYTLYQRFFNADGVWEETKCGARAIWQLQLEDLLPRHLDKSGDGFVGW